MEEEKSEPPKREQIVNFLWTVRAEFLAEINKGTDREKAGKKIGKKLIKGGMFSVQVAFLANRGI